MIKKAVFTIIFLLIVVSSVHLISAQTQEIEIDTKRVDYTLPYHGILPDHPVYFLKNIRDKFLVFFTRDPFSKAELFILLSDKRAGMAQALAGKGKWKLAAQTIYKGEEYFEKIPGLITQSKKQGVSPEGDFIIRTNLANEKHREIIEDLSKKAPQGEREYLEKAHAINSKIREDMSSL